MLVGEGFSGLTTSSALLLLRLLLGRRLQHDPGLAVLGATAARVPVSPAFDQKQDRHRCREGDDDGNARSCSEASHARHFFEIGGAVSIRPAEPDGAQRGFL